MSQNHSAAFVNITGSVFVSISLVLGIFLAVSFSNEEKTNSFSKGPHPDPDSYWDESSCRCLSEEEPELNSTVFLQAGLVSSELFSWRYLSR